MPIDLLTPEEATAIPVTSLPPHDAALAPRAPASPHNNPPATVASRQAIIQKLADLKVDKADRRKMRFLRLLRKTINANRDLPDKPFPDIDEVLKAAKIPYGTFHAWRSEDPKFIAILEEIEEQWLDDCVKVVHDAKVKNPYIALDLLRSRRRAKWGQQVNVNATYTHIHVVSNIARPDIPMDERPLDKSGRDRTRRSMLENAEETQYEEGGNGENDALSRENTLGE